MLSLERRAGAGARGVEEKVEKALWLSNLSEMLPAGWCLFGLQCRSLLRDRETGVEGKTEPVRSKGEKERGHAAFSYRLLPTIAESGSLHIRLSCRLCHLAWV